jgi:hypothetical protein
MNVHSLSNRVFGRILSAPGLGAEPPLRKARVRSSEERRLLARPQGRIRRGEPVVVGSLPTTG